MMLETAIVAARLGGQRAVEELQFIKVSEKSSDELVTQADAKCQQIIIERIKETYSDHGFIAEEGNEGKIDLKKFHDRVLSYGSPPFKHLRELLNLN